MGFEFLDLGFPKSGTDWKSINGKPEIVISSKGRSNGLSKKINDGADFGVDTTLGATSPNQIGAPYSVTGGLQELFNYVATLDPIYPNNTVIGHKILIKGFIQVHADITLKYNNPQYYAIEGESLLTSGINFLNNTRGIILDNFPSTIEFSNLIFESNNNASPTGENPAQAVESFISGLYTSTNRNMQVVINKCDFFAQSGYEPTKGCLYFSNPFSIIVSNGFFDTNPIALIYGTGTSPSPQSQVSFINCWASQGDVSISMIDTITIEGCYILM